MFMVALQHRQDAFLLSCCETTHVMTIVHFQIYILNMKHTCRGGRDRFVSISVGLKVPRNLDQTSAPTKVPDQIVERAESESVCQA